MTDAEKLAVFRSSPIKLFGKEIDTENFSKYVGSSIIVLVIIVFFYLLTFTDVIRGRTKYIPPEQKTQEQLEEEYYRQKSNEYNTPDCSDTRFGVC